MPAAPPRRRRFLLPVLALCLLAGAIGGLIAYGKWRQQQQQQQTPPAGDDTGTLELTWDDADVELRLDGEVVPLEDRQGPITLKAGDHELILARDGQERSERFTIRKGETLALQPDLPDRADRAKPVTPVVPGPSPFVPAGLEGWEGAVKHWRVEKGELIGFSDVRSGPSSNFLISKKKYRDFEMSFKARLRGGRGVSGVVFRGATHGPRGAAVTGPKLDINKGHWGDLFNQAPDGGSVQARALGVVGLWVKDDDFNDCLLRVVGKRVLIKVNNITAVDEDVPNLPAEGVIAFHLSHAVPVEVAFKHIVFKELPPEPPAPVFRSVFNGKDLAGWKVSSGDASLWAVEGGELVAKAGTPKPGQGWLMTEKEYRNFVLRLEFKLSAKANSGVGLRLVPGEQTPLEVQILDDPGYPQGKPDTLSGALFNLARDRAAPLRPQNQWNELEVELKGQELRVSVNGVQTVAVGLDRLVDRADRWPGLKRPQGHLGLQNWAGGEVRFRNIQIKELP
jgi:hypothetical protein